MVFAVYPPDFATVVYHYLFEFPWQNAPHAIPACSVEDVVIRVDSNVEVVSGIDLSQFACNLLPFARLCLAFEVDVVIEVDSIDVAIVLDRNDVK